MKWKRKIGLSISLILSIQVAMIDTSNIYAENTSLHLISTEIITSGATLQKYDWKTIRNSQEATIEAQVIEVDLNNPSVKLDAITGTNQQFTRKLSVVEMAKDAGAIAGINGDFYNTKAEGVPEGPQITNGKLVATPPKISGLYSFVLNKDNQPIIDIFTFDGKIVTSNGTSYELGGINKTYYWGDSKKHSHIDSMYMYTNTWGSIDRSNDGVTNPSEILVQNNVITYMGINEVLPIIPPEDGYILRATGKATEFVKANMKVGDYLQAQYKMLPLDASITDDPQTFKMMIGGHTLLVHEGAPSYFTKDISGIDGYRYRSRSAIGYSADKRKIYLITVGQQGVSKGMSIPELQQFMIQIGVSRGMVLDGGGSTQMASRPLGEFDVKLVNKPEIGVERKVVNGIGVFSTAPQGDLKGIIIQGPKEIFTDELYTYSVKAFDSFYNPMTLNSEQLTWSVIGSIGEFKNGKFIAGQQGTTKIKAQIGSISTEFDVLIMDRNNIQDMKILPAGLVISQGETYPLTVMLTTKTGKNLKVPNHLIDWEIIGVQGEVSDGNLVVHDTKGSRLAQVIATFDGYSAMLSLPVGIDQMWYDLDQLSYLTTSENTTSGSASSVEIVNQIEGNQHLKLSYDFSIGTGVTKAKAIFGSNNGIQIEGNPQYIKMRMHGNGSLHSVFAEFADANQRIYPIKLTESMNWEGWKEVTVNLADVQMKHPISLKSIAVHHKEDMEDENLVKGHVLLDDIRFTYKEKAIPEPTSQIALTINDKKIIVDQNAIELQQAPVIIQGKTMIPIRFVAHALGGIVNWDSVDQKVSLRQGDKLIELWIQKPEVNINGKKVLSEVSPQLLNELAVVPLRLISENLGWQVKWNEKNQSILLK